MKKFLMVILSLMFALFAFAACGEDDSSSSEWKTKGETSKTITYQMVIKDEVQNVMVGMYKDGANYPKWYNEGESVTIDNLKSQYQTFNSDGSGVEYNFKGWYLDEACEQEFTGITTQTRGDITLYAKITYASWSPNV